MCAEHGAMYTPLRLKVRARNRTDCNFVWIHRRTLNARTHRRETYLLFNIAANDIALCKRDATTPLASHRSRLEWCVHLFGSIVAMAAVVSVVSFLTLRSGARLMPLLVGGTGVLSIITGAIWLQKTSPALF